MTMTDITPETRTFYNKRIEKALEACQKAGYRPLFMPELVDARSNGTAPWNQWSTTPSIRATGRTKQGTAVVVYAHIPNYLSYPENIREAKLKGVVNYAARLPQAEFQRLADAKDNKTVWVVDHGVLKRSESGEIKVKDALKHPQVIPFLGGRERAEQYLQAHEKAYDSRTIYVFHRDDLHDESPLARLLFLGVGSCDYDGLYGGDSIGGLSQFLGVRQINATGARKISEATVLQTKEKRKLPLVERIMTFSKEYIPQQRHAEYEQEVRRRFPQ